MLYRFDHRVQIWIEPKLFERSLLLVLSPLSKACYCLALHICVMGPSQLLLEALADFSRGERRWSGLAWPVPREEGWVETGPMATASRCRSVNVRRWWARVAFANMRPKIAVDLGDQRRYSCADVLSMSTDLYDA